VCLAAQSPVVIGASMGGLTALLAHSEKPKVELESLVLVDIAPRWDDRGVDAMIAFMRQNPKGFTTLEEATEACAASCRIDASSGSNSGLNRNLRQGSDQRWYWHWDPGHAGAGRKEQQPAVASASRPVVA
jgi:pimeloyl-ACP methyl ester carboxylesterase